MTILTLEGGNYGGAILLVLFIMFGIPLALLIVGLAIKTKHKKTGKILLIIAAIYLIISLGYCGAMMF